MKEFPIRQIVDNEDEPDQVTSMSWHMARGATLGMALGTGLWAMILFAIRIIKP